MAQKTEALMNPLPKRVKAVLAVCADDFGVTVDSILGPSHSRRVVQARRQAMRQLRAMNMSQPEIGRYLQKHHTSICYGLQQPAEPKRRELTDHEIEARVWELWVRKFGLGRLRD